MHYSSRYPSQRFGVMGDVMQEDSKSFCGAPVIWKTDGGYIAGSDHRKDGQAVAF